MCPKWPTSSLHAMMTYFSQTCNQDLILQNMQSWPIYPKHKMMTYFSQTWNNDLFLPNVAWWPISPKHEMMTYFSQTWDDDLFLPNMRWWPISPKDALDTLAPIEYRPLVSIAVSQLVNISAVNWHSHMGNSKTTQQQPRKVECYFTDVSFSCHQGFRLRLHLYYSN